MGIYRGCIPWDTIIYRGDILWRTYKMFPTVYNSLWVLCIYRGEHVVHGISRYIPCVCIYRGKHGIYRGNNSYIPWGIDIPWMHFIYRGGIPWVIYRGWYAVGTNIIPWGYAVGNRIYRGLQVPPRYIALYPTEYKIVTHGISHLLCNDIPWV